MSDAPANKEDSDISSVPDISTVEQLEAYIGAMDDIYFEKNIKEIATKTGFPVAFLRKTRKNVRTAPDDKKQGTEITFDDPDPGEYEFLSTNGASIAKELTEIIKRYVVLSPGAAETIALWIMFSYAFKSFVVAPILLITSAVMRCGKTTLLLVLKSLVRRPLFASHASTPALFRGAEKYDLTVIADELDTYLYQNEDLRNFFNSGHLKGGSYLRCVGEDYEPRSFNTWVPKITAKIGKYPATMQDRGITVSLRRKLPHETVERFRIDRPDQHRKLKAQMIKWADEHKDFFSLDAWSNPQIPEQLNDRAADNWRPLFTIADIIGGDWGAKIREIAVDLSKDPDEDVKTMLLEDIHSYFEQQDTDRISSHELVNYLGTLEDRPWPEWTKAGKRITPRGVAKLLKDFGIMPLTLKINGEGCKGYKLEDFQETFSRYLGSIRLSVTETDNSIQDNDLDSYGSVTGNGYTRNLFEDIEEVTDTNVTRNLDVTDETGANSLPDNEIAFDGYGYTDKNDISEEEKKEQRENVQRLIKKTEKEMELTDPGESVYQEMKERLENLQQELRIMEGGEDEIPI